MSKRYALLSLLVVSIMLIALPVLAQEVAGAGEGDELADAFLTITGFAGLSVVLKKITERLIKWFTFLKGDLITLAAVIVGSALSYLFAVDPTTAIAEAVGRPIIDLPDFVLYVISGVLMAFLAGYLADREELKYGAIAGAQNVALHGSESHTGE